MTAAAPGWLLAGGIVLASLTDAIAGTALSLARPDLIGDTHATPDAFAWLDIGYTALKLVGFALAPWLLTRLRPLSVVAGATLAMGVVCGLAATTAQLGPLIVLRAAQGLAGGCLLVGGQAILFWAYPATRQPLLQAAFAVGAVVAPATIAPALAGWLVDHRDWTWIFLLVVPIVLGAAGLLLLVRDPGPAPVGPRRPFDPAGLAILALAFVGASYLLSQGSRWDWLDAPHIGWLTLAVGVAAILFLYQQRRAGRRALFDRAPFRVDDFTFAFLVSFVAGAALFGSAFLIPSFAVAVLRFTPTDAGLLLLPSGALFALALLVAALLFQGRRVPPIATVPAGILLIMAAMWMLSGSNGDSGSHDMMPALLLRGLGLGFLFLSITLIAFARLPPASVAYGIGLFNIGRQLGGLIGVAALQTVIEQESAANRIVLNASLTPGDPALAERLASTAAFLAGQGMDAAPAAAAATALLARSVAGQSALIAYGSGFTLIALLFVVAAPLIILAKAVIGRAGRRRRARPPDGSAGRAVAAPPA